MNTREARAHDVAAFILERMGSASTLKLQKLLYYSQAWSIAWDRKALFTDPIQAWQNGPVVPSVWQTHRGAYQVATMPGGDPSVLNAQQRQTVEEICRFYGPHDGEWLSELTHREKPWRQARSGIPDEARSTATITHEMLGEYFGRIPLPAGKRLPAELERGCDLLLSLAPDEVDLLDVDANAEYDPEELTRWLVHGVDRPGSAD